MFRWFQTSYEKLIEAIEAKNTAEAGKLIIEMNIIELSKVANNGDTALIYAVDKGLDKVCEMLIPKMSSKAINHITNNGWTALILAASKGLDKVCEMLIPKMTEQAINQINNNGYTALTFATSYGLEKVCEMLIPKMTEQAINQINNNSETALIYAVDKGLDKVCEMLIPKMSSKAINHITNNGWTALILAASKGLEKVCEMLILKMSSQAINHITNNGETALIKATYKGLDKICEMLIPKMSSQTINAIRKSDGETALSIAKSKEFKNICDLLTNKKIIIAEEEDICQIIGKIIFNLQDSTNIDEADKSVIEYTLYRIADKMQKLIDKNDIINITQSIKELIGNEITEGVVIDLEDEVKEMVKKQAQKKLNIFNEIVTKIITKLETANIKDSAAIKTHINEISSKVQTLENNVSIEQITNWMGKLIDGKITKGTVIDLRKKIDTIILQEINESTNVITFAVKEIIYYNPLLNHPKKLLQTALDNKLSPDLIYDAITNNDEELILAGLMSLEIYTPPAG